MRFAIYVRKGEETYDAVDAIPEQLRKRTLAARSFDEDGMMIERELVEGSELEGAIQRLFAEPRASYLHLHYAAPGCYAARVERTGRLERSSDRCLYSQEIARTKARSVSGSRSLKFAPPLELRVDRAAANARGNPVVFERRFTGGL